MMEKSAFFYVEDGLVACNNLVWLHWLFYVITVLFKRVGLWTNMAKMAAMVCHTGPIADRHSTPTYGMSMAGEGNSYWLRQRRWVICMEYGADLVNASLAAHMETWHL